MGNEELKDQIIQVIVEKKHLSPSEQATLILAAVEGNGEDLLLGKLEYDSMRSLSHQELLNSAFPKYLGEKRKEIPADEARFLCIAEGVLNFLISKKCFKKIPKFDYRSRMK